MQKQCSEQQMNQCAVFIDLMEVFDMVSWEALWITLSKLGGPQKFTTMVKFFHNNMKGQVLSNRN